MLVNTEAEKNNKKNNITNNEDIDFISIFKILIRNKNFISKITLISVFAGIFYGFSLKKIWEGQFQIVLTQEAENSSPLSELGSLQASSSLAGFKLSKNGDPLQTEVGILKSPLVLNEVFNYVKKTKSIDEKNTVGSLTFNAWKNGSLNIDLEEGTSILNLSYRDSNKELILPVLEKISKSYQLYSGRRRLRKINLGKTYLENQINIFKVKATNSLRKAQEFAIEENLSILQGQADLDKEIPNQINIEAIRINSANKIRDIEMQLKELKNMEDPESLMYMGSLIPELVNQGLPQELDDIDRNVIRLNTLKEEITNFGDNPKKIQYFGNSIPQLQETGLPEQLRQIETEIEFKKFIYKENDKFIIDLIKKRDLLIKVFKDQAINYINADIDKLNNSKPKLIKLLKLKTESFLKARKASEEAILKASERPKGVVLKYKELLGAAEKDGETLESLELNYRALLLEEAKTEDPWELITTPTLLNSAVFPNKKNIVMFSFILGLLLGSLFSLLIEKRKKIIFDSSFLVKELELPLICELSAFDHKLFAEELKILFKSSFLKNKKSITFLKEFDIESLINNKLEQFIKSKNFQIQKIKNYTDEKELNEVILMPILGKININNIKRDVNRLNLLGVNIIGLVPIKEKNEDRGILITEELVTLLNSIFTIFNAIKKEIKHTFKLKTVREKIIFFYDYFNKK